MFLCYQRRDGRVRSARFLGVNCAVPLILGVDDPLFLIDFKCSMVEARSFPNENRAKGSCPFDVAPEKKLIPWFRS